LNDGTHRCSINYLEQARTWENVANRGPEVTVDADSKELRILRFVPPTK
jgi:hypothetical protein